MSGPARTSTPPEASDAPERSRLSLDDLTALPDGSPELERALPRWVADAHVRWLETGEGDPWGGYFS